MRKKVSEAQLLVYGAYTQIAEYLQHYNGIQVTYRTFASTWLLATFVGIGYSLSPKEVNLPFHPLIAAAFIALASATGIFLIWYLDLIVCEQSIAAVVYEGIELEKEHKWLPKYYHNVNQIASLISYVNLKAVFYMGCFSILFITVGSCITFYLLMKHAYFSFLVPFLTIIVILTTCFLLIIAMKKTDPYKRLKALKGKNLV